MLGGQGWTALVTEAPIGTCGVMPALVLLGSLLQAFWLPSLPNCLYMAWQLLCWPCAARFQMLPDVVFSKAGTDGYKQLSDCI